MAAGRQGLLESLDALGPRELLRADPEDSAKCAQYSEATGSGDACQILEADVFLRMAQQALDSGRDQPRLGVRFRCRAVRFASLAGSKAGLLCRLRGRKERYVATRGTPARASWTTVDASGFHRVKELPVGAPITAEHLLPTGGEVERTLKCASSSKWFSRIAIPSCLRHRVPALLLVSSAGRGLATLRRFHQTR